MKKLLYKLDLYHYISDLNRARKRQKEILRKRDIAYAVREKLGFSNEQVSSKKKYPLAIVAIFKNETDYLQEWIEFYLLMGVEQFYLYDNNEDSSALSVLQEYIDQGVVTHIPWPTIEDERLQPEYDKPELFCTQHLAYGDFILRFRNQCQWVMKVDIDEFSYPVPASPYRSITHYLKTLDVTKVKAILMGELRFGGDGHDTKPKGPVIENYKKADWGSSFKSIANTSFLEVLPYSDCHDFEYVIKYGTYIIKKQSDENPLQYNHYYTKSKEEFLRRGAYNKKNWMNGKRTELAFEEMQELYNRDRHEEILPFLSLLQEKLQEQ